MTKRAGAPCACPRKHHGRCRDDAQARLLGRVLEQPDGCWFWTGEIGPTGYARFWFDGRSGAAHRASYRLFVGPIPNGKQIDHVCHNADTTCTGRETCLHRRCVNPAHLEAVTARTNVLRTANTPTGLNIRKTHCTRGGHSLSGANLYVNPRGNRECRTCRHAAVAAWQARLRMKVA